MCKRDERYVHIRCYQPARQMQGLGRVWEKDTPPNSCMPSTEKTESTMKKKDMKVTTDGTDAIMRYGMDRRPAAVNVSTRVYLRPPSLQAAALE